MYICGRGTDENGKFFRIELPKEYFGLQRIYYGTIILIEAIFAILKLRSMEQLKM